MANELEQYLGVQGVEPDADGMRRVYINTGAPNRLLSKMDGVGDGSDDKAGAGGFDLATITANISKLIENLGMAGVQPGYEAPAPMQKLLGLNGQERYQTWPEKMIRSGLTLPGDVVSGAEPMLAPGLRREDFTDAVPPQDRNMLGLKPSPWQPGDRVIERAQDTSGLMAGGSLGGVTREAATLGSGPVRPGIIETPVAPAFYSAVEHSVANAPQPKMGYDQWMGYLKNQPGVKGEELSWMGLGEKNPFEGKTVSKAQMEDWVNNHKVEIQEVKKSGDKDIETALGDRTQEIMDTEYPGIKDDHPEYWDRWDEAQSRAEDELRGGIGGGGTQPKFTEYQLPGGENYREMLFTLPGKGITPERLAEIKALETKTGNSYDRYLRKMLDDHGSQWQSNATPEQLAKFEDLRGKALQASSDYVAATRAGGSKDSYQSSHWDEPNVLAHTRLNDRVIGAVPISDIEAKVVAAYPDVRYRDMGSGMAGKAVRDKVLTPEEAADWSRAREWVNDFADKPGTGKKSLHVEEIQSDWHQEGRKKGYKSEAEADKKRMQELLAEAKTLSPSDPRYKEIYAELPRLSSNSMSIDKIPDAPFKTTWPDLVLKRLIREASEKGYDQISWTPGEAQAARYDLSKQIQKLEYDPDSKKLWVTEQGRGNTPKVSGMYEPDKLTDVIGKEAAEKLLGAEPGKNGNHTLEGLDLKVGGEGMKAFYDKMLVDKANALGKKFGAKVKTGKVAGNTGIQDAPTVHTPPRQVYDTLVEYDPKIKEKYPTISSFVDHYNNLNTEQRATLIAEARSKGEQPVYVLPITDKMREAAIGKGFPLFMSGIPFPLVPVEGNPWERQK